MVMPILELYEDLYIWLAADELDIDGVIALGDAVALVLVGSESVWAMLGVAVDPHLLCLAVGSLRDLSHAI